MRTRREYGTKGTAEKKSAVAGEIIDVHSVIEDRVANVLREIFPVSVVWYGARKRRQQMPIIIIQWLLFKTLIFFRHATPRRLKPIFLINELVRRWDTKCKIKEKKNHFRFPNAKEDRKKLGQDHDNNKTQMVWKTDAKKKEARNEARLKQKREELKTMRKMWGRNYELQVFV